MFTVNNYHNNWFVKEYKNYYLIYKNVNYKNRNNSNQETKRI